MTEQIPINEVNQVVIIAADVNVKPDPMGDVNLRRIPWPDVNQKCGGGEGGEGGEGGDKL